LKDANGVVRFRNSYVMITPTEAQALLAKLEKGVKLRGSEAIRALLAGEEDGFVFDGDDALQRMTASLTDVKDLTVPASIHAQLRPYQVRGFQWMYSTLERGFGVILADDMGLGKTLQTLTLLERLKDDGKLPHHALIVCPTTLATNWEREIQRFAPRLSVSIYHGSEREFDFEGSDIVITTYGILRREAKEFAAHSWSIIVVDEAQNMKNHETTQTKAVKSIPAPMKVALSGTPVENRLSELWSLFDWLNHGYLYGITRFRDDFAKPIEKDRDAGVVERLRRITAPFILRRLKSDKSIIADLPDKIITNEYCTLTKEQAALYETTVQNAFKALEGNTEADKIERSGMIFSMITALKQVCNHPANYTKKGNPKAKDSGKAARLMELLDTMQEAGEKALIFTQYTEMGTLLQEMIRAELGIESLFFHGGITRKKRDLFVERFQSDPDVRFMIVSLKAGGTGLNLTAASNVVHYDLWWNPAVENQATDRAYRIGQTRNVQVHRFITQHTFEEKIDAMIQAKQELANLTVGTGESWITEMSNKELREIFTLAW
jgi:SNF2 family DNA or RNA helicase